MAVLVSHHRVRLLPHLDFGHLHIVVEVNDLNGIVTLGGSVVDIIIRPVADIKFAAHLHHLFRRLAHLDSACMLHFLWVDNPQVGTHQITDVCFVGSHKMNLTRRIEVGEFEGLRGIANHCVGIHLINIIAVVDDDIQFPVDQSHALSHIAKRGIVHLVKQVVAHRIGLNVVERQ